VATTEQDIIQTFTELDLNADGQITMREFQTAMAARGETVTEPEIKSIFRDADTDHDGLISLAEFTAAWNRAEEL
jgi:Ca2+-binding EF-hand superfamily protein